MTPSYKVNLSYVGFAYEIYTAEDGLIETGSLDAATEREADADARRLAEMWGLVR